jgi:hypothetical protein
MADNGREFQEYIGLGWNNEYVSKLREEHSGVNSVSVESPGSGPLRDSRSDRVRVKLNEQLRIESVMRG